MSAQHITGYNRPIALLSKALINALLNALLKSMATIIPIIKAITIISIISIITVVTVTAGLLFGFAGQGLALPVWPVTEDPNGRQINEDRIGYENGSYLEFMDTTLDPNSVIEYRVGEEWTRFPHRLNSKNHVPHTVHILFEVSVAVTDALNLVLAARTDAPTGQHLGIFLDGYPIHLNYDLGSKPCLASGGEEIQPGSTFQEHTFWLGYMSRGEHRITLSNVTDIDAQTGPATNFGIYFDYIKLVPGAKVGISLAADAGTGSAAVLADFTTLGLNDPAISGLLLPRAHFYAGFWDLRIIGLEPGAGIKVKIHCPPESFFALQEYYALDGPGPGYNGGWKAMKITRDPARSTVTVELGDGGDGDADMTRDGSISHIGGIAVPFSLGGGYDYQGCFIFSLFRL